MKKLAILTSAIIMAVVANAGSANWSSNAIFAPGTETYLENAIAYLFVGSSTDGVADSILAGTFTGAGSVKTATMEGVDGLYASKWGTYTSESVSAYMVLFDAENIADANNFIVSDIVTQTFGASGNKTFDFSSSVIDANWQAVPEPTSGLLLLLGVAGLALRRKKA
jgi:hypothetical protein